MQLPLEDLLGESRGFYQSVLRNRDASTRDKLQARQALDHLLGLPWARQRQLEQTPPAVETRDPVFAPLREAGRDDPERFAASFFSHLTPKPFCAMHRDFFARYRQLNGTRGWREVTAAPRGHAKTTVKGMIKTIQDCVYGLERFIVVISSTGMLAEDKVKQIRDELEQNPLLTQAFGPQRGPRWNNADFITAGGTRVVAASPSTQVRGLLERGQRPTKILLDDAEHSDHVHTQLQRDKLRQWFLSDIMKLGTADTNIEVIGTVLHPQSLLADLLQNPGFHGRVYQAVRGFATQTALWQQWRQLFINLDDPRRQERAHAFFVAHEAAMLEGADMLWPEHLSYEQLMIIRLVEGEIAFQLELQNNATPADVYIFDMERAGYCTVSLEHVRRHDGRQVSMLELAETLVAFWDPALGQSGRLGDYSCCVIVGKDRFGYRYVLDCYLSNTDPPDRQLDAVADLLWRWRPGRVGLEANGFQSLLREDLEQALARLQVERQESWSPVLVPVTNMRAKHVRISSLEPMVANRWMWFADHLPAEFRRQFEAFLPLPDAGKDDAPDAVEGAERVLEGLV